MKAKRMTKAEAAARAADQRSAALAERFSARLLSIDAEDRAFAERQKKRIYQQVFGRQNFHEEGKPSS